MEEKVKELAEYLNIEPEEIETVDNIIFNTPEGDFAVYDEDKVHEAIVDNIESMFDDMGLRSFTDDFAYWILENAIDEKSVDDFIQEEIDFYEGENDRDALTALYELDSTEDKLAYIRYEFGDDVFSDWLEDKIDMDVVADRAEEIDGAGHFLAYYDGEEISLPNYLAYRVN